MSQISKRRRQDRIAGVLLLVLLALNLVHSHAHFVSTVGLATGNPDTAVSASKESREGTTDKLQPCLACTCQKQSLIFFASCNLLFEPLRVNHQVLEDHQTVVSLSSFNRVLSRAPPAVS
jgi:hypothetical protein